MGIVVTLNGLDFELPTRAERDFSELTDWFIEVNETLASQSTSFNITAGSANLIDASPVNLHVIDSPQTNSHIVFEYGIYRRTTDVGGVGAVSLSVTGILLLSYNILAGEWNITDTANGDSKVEFDISSNTIRATATALTGTPDTSVVYYGGRIIKS